MERDTNQDDDPTVAFRGSGAESEQPTQSLDTRVEPAARGRSVTSPSARRAPSSITHTVTSAEDALRLEEIDRVRTFIRLGWALSVMVIAAVPLVDGHVWIGRVMIGGLIAGIAISFVFDRFVCTPDRFSETRLLWSLGLMATLNANLVVLFCGTFSASTTIIVIGVYFLARVQNRTEAILLIGFAALGHLSCAALIMFDVIVDPAIWPPSRPLTNAEMLIAEGIVLVLYTTTFIAGRSARSSSVASIESLKRAVGLAAQREAMVAELRADLNIALKVGGPGRYTDRELGDYRLGMLIGRGGMGEVYCAEHIETGQEAAVKLLHRELLGAPKQLSRFLREVDTSRGFESEHVVRILAASGPEDPVPFLVMERLEGETLNARLRRDQTLDLSAVVELTRQVARALDEARERGIVHRDIKPQNLFCVSRGGSPVWKVLDFGVASLTDHTGTLTQGAVVGTPAYMSPEQAQGLSVDARADVYGLTAVIYRCLTGRPPFSSHDMPSLLYKVVHDSAPPVSTLAAVPAALDVVIERGLAKQPAKRFDTAGQLALAIDQAAGR